MPSKYNVVFLPAETTALVANLDELSIQGWEFVTWMTEWLSSEPPSRMALMRRVEPTPPTVEARRE